MNDIQHMTDRLEGQKKTPPVTSRGLTETLVQVGDPAVKNPSNTREPVGQQALAIHLLELTREQHDRSKRARVYYAKLAREHGHTNQEIGTALGMTEAGVRLMLSRAGV